MFNTVKMQSAGALHVLHITCLWSRIVFQIPAFVETVIALAKLHYMSLHSCPQRDSSSKKTEMTIICLSFFNGTQKEMVRTMFTPVSSIYSKDTSSFGLLFRLVHFINLTLDRDYFIKKRCLCARFMVICTTKHYNLQFFFSFFTFKKKCIPLLFWLSSFCTHSSRPNKFVFLQICITCYLQHRK